MNEEERNNAEVTEWWLTRHKAKVYQNAKPSDNRSCDLNCGHEWIVVVPNPDENDEKDSLVCCADSVEEACEMLQEILYCSKHFEHIFCSDILDYRDELEHECDGFYCGAREQYEHMEKKFGDHGN